MGKCPVDFVKFITKKKIYSRQSYVVLSKILLPLVFYFYFKRLFD